MKHEQESHISSLVDMVEHLEQNLLAFEEMLDAEGDSTDLVHHIFRVAHNLKSTLGMAGYHDASELIHLVESNFDLIRNGLAEATQTLVHQCLLAVDAIRYSIFLPEEKHDKLQLLQKDLESIFVEARQAHKDRFGDSSLSPEQSVDGGIGKAMVEIQFPLSERQRGLLGNMMKEGFSIFQIEKIINPQLLSRLNYEELPIYEDIRDVGIHIATYPDYDALPKDKTEALMRIVIATTFGVEELESHIFDPVKPVRTDALLQPAAQLGGDEPPSERTSLHKVRAIKPLSILIAEDDFVSRTILAEILSPFGVCDLAADGREAVLAFEQTLNEGMRYDLVCLDIMMPVMDGTQALKNMRDAEENFGITGHSRSKIVMTTALDTIDQVFKAFRLQCDAYITKPISRGKVLHQLRKLHLLEPV